MPTPLTSTYGADSTGLICGFHFGVGVDGTGDPLDTRRALQWLAQDVAVTGAGGGFVWLHFNLAHSGTEKWLRDNLQLSDVFHESLKVGSQSTRVELDDDMLVAVVNDVHYDFAFEPTDISTMWLSVGPRLVVSARLQPLRSIDRLRNAVKKGALCRLLVRLQRLLAPEPAALFRLLKLPPDWMDAQDVEDLRQSTEEFNVVLSDMAALQERIKLLQEEIAGRVAEANNRSLYVLTIVTVLALPINIIAGLLGMNVGGIPLSASPHGF